MYLHILSDIEDVEARLLSLKCLPENEYCHTSNATENTLESEVLEKTFASYCGKGGYINSELSDSDVLDALSDLGTPLKHDELKHIRAHQKLKHEEWGLNDFRMLSQKAQRLHFLSTVLEESKLYMALEQLFPDNIDEICRLDENQIESKLKCETFTAMAAKNIANVIATKSSRFVGLARSLNSKFISDGAEFCEFGDDDEFHGGLEESIGLPDPLILKSILSEHLHTETSDQLFLTTNYGLCTTPEMELAFILGHREDFQFLIEQCKANEKNCGPSLEELQSLERDFDRLQAIHSTVLQRRSGKFPGEIGDCFKELLVKLQFSNPVCESTFSGNLVGYMQENFHPKRFSDFPTDRHLQQEFLLRLSKIQVQGTECIKLISLPMSKKLFGPEVQDALLDAAAFSAGVERSQIAIAEIEEKHWAFVESPALGKNELQGRRSLSIRSLMGTAQVTGAGLRVEEAIVVHEYTGPMFMPWNGVLRNMGSTKNKYTTTLHCLVSATTKLGRNTTVPKSRKLWRGLGSRVLRDSTFFTRDGRGTRGGVERGFLSTSTKMEVAMQYSGHDRRCGTVLEFDFGKVDCPAEIDALSQYPGEGEMLFGPLCYLEAVGSARLESYLDSTILIVPIRINCNLKAETVDEIIAKRQFSQFAVIKSLMKEIKFEFAKLPDVVVRDNAHDNPERVPLKRDTQRCAVNASSCSIQSGVCSINRKAALSAFVCSVRGPIQHDSSARVLEDALAALTGLLDLAMSRDQSWFNEDENYRAAWNEALDLKNEIVSGWWLRSLLKDQSSQKFFEMVAAFKERRPLSALSKQAKIEAEHLGVIKGTHEEAKANYLSSLINVCSEGKVMELRLLFLAGAGINGQDGGGRSALHVAAETCQLDVISSLIDIKADLNSHGKQMRSILQFAESNVLLNQYHPHELKLEKWTPVHRICNHCGASLSRDTAKLLHCDDCSYSLCMGCFARSGRQCSRTLKLAGADGWNALMVAAEEGKAEELKSLLSQADGPAMLSAAEIQGKTAGHVAATQGHLDCVMLLGWT